MNCSPIQLFLIVSLDIIIFVGIIILLSTLSDFIDEKRNKKKKRDKLFQFTYKQGLDAKRLEQDKK